MDRKARVRQLGFAIGLLGAMAIIPVACCHGGLFVGMFALDPFVAGGVAIFLVLAWFSGRGVFAVLSSFLVGPALVFVNSPEGRASNLRGINTRVVSPGAVRVGEPVRKL